MTEKYRPVLDDLESQAYNIDIIASSLPLTEKCRTSFQDNTDETINRLNAVVGRDHNHSNLIEYAGHSFRSLIARLFSSFLQHNYLPKATLMGLIRPSLKD